MLPSSAAATRSPSGVAKNALLFASYVAIVVAVLLGTTLALAGLGSLVDGEPMLALINFRAGLIGALLVALILASFHLRKTTVQLRVSSQDAFLRRMRKIFADLGHVVVQKSNVVWRTKPAFRSMLFGEGITVVLDGKRATLSGPSFSLDQIRRRYRMVSQLEKLQESMTDTRTRGPECFMKRFELSARLEPEQLAAFHDRVVAALGQEASVILDVQMMVASDAGVRESVWQNEIRPWLDDEGICYDFHRDHAQQIAPHGARPEVVGEKTDPTLLDSCVWSSSP
ncbi:MAG TPA: hypothetical protein VHR72_05205 [Gemmataceae bacterium]|jgi:hypothetical protein|nr:hypothetical protein [Gemmataceae bacterium]